MKRNLFTHGEELVYTWRETCLHMKRNLFTHEEKLVYTWRGSCLLAETNTFALYFASDIYYNIYVRTWQAQYLYTHTLWS